MEGQLPDQKLSFRCQFIDPDGAFAGPISQGIAAFEPQSVPSSPELNNWKCCFICGSSETHKCSAGLGLLVSRLDDIQTSGTTVIRRCTNAMLCRNLTDNSLEEAALHWGILGISSAVLSSVYGASRSRRSSHVPLLPTIPKAKVSKLSTLELVSRPVHSTAWKSIVSELTLRRAAGDYINDKKSKFPVMM